MATAITVAALASPSDITTPGTAAASTMEFINDGRSLLVIKTGATTANLGIVSQGTTPDGAGNNLAIADLPAALAANKTYVFPPLKPSIYNDSNGKVQLTFDAVTSILVAVLRLPTRV